MVELVPSSSGKSYGIVDIYEFVDLLCRQPVDEKVVARAKIRSGTNLELVPGRGLREIMPGPTWNQFQVA